MDYDTGCWINGCVGVRNLLYPCVSREIDPALVLDTSEFAWVERLKDYGATLVLSDLHDPNLLADAFLGVYEVICSPIPLPSGWKGDTHRKNVDLTGVMNLIDAAKDAEVPRFLYISFSKNMGMDTPTRKRHQVIEHSLIKSGIPYTILQTCDYPSQVSGSRAQPTSRISIKELARLATQALTNPAQRNAIVELGGSPVPGSNNETTRVAIGVEGFTGEVNIFL